MQTASHLPARLSRIGILGLLTLLLAGLVAPPADASTAFQFRGSGWGHGVGMSQYGALEQARDGRSAEQIVAHYYQGAKAAKPNLGLGKILIGLSQGRTNVTVTPKGGAMTVRFAGKDRKVAAGSSARLAMWGSDGRCHLILNGKEVDSASACSANFTRHSGTRLTVSNETVEYGRGRILFRPREGKPSVFHVVAELPNIETYLLGLREVPQSWPKQALRAQAITGRSYAAFDLLGGGVNKKSCWCNLYDSVKSQVYGGTTGETAAWREAVSSTAGMVVWAPGQTGTRGGGVVQAFYSSSSGGRTEAIEDSSAFASGPRPYFSSVGDKWSLRGSNPYASWVLDVPESTIRKRLGLDDVLSIAVRDRNTSGSARTVVFNGTRSGSPATATTTGDKLRGLLGLRSGYISTIFLPPFIDDDGNRFEADIAWLSASGITSGCNPPANDRFCPDRDVTRGQMAAFLNRALDLPAGTKTFSDTKGHRFEADIAAIAREGITTGCNSKGTKFCPDAPVSRGQMAAFLNRAFDLPAGTKTFSDTKGHRFEADIAAIAREGITKGCSSDGSKFCPETDISRAQMAAFLHRAPL